MFCTHMHIQYATGGFWKKEAIVVHDAFVGNLNKTKKETCHLIYLQRAGYFLFSFLLYNLPHEVSYLNFLKWDLHNTYSLRNLKIHWMAYFRVRSYFRRNMVFIYTLYRKSDVNGRCFLQLSVLRFHKRHS